MKITNVQLLSATRIDCVTAEAQKMVAVRNALSGSVIKFVAEDRQTGFSSIRANAVQHSLFRRRILANSRKGTEVANAMVVLPGSKNDIKILASSAGGSRGGASSSIPGDPASPGGSGDGSGRGPSAKILYDKACQIDLSGDHVGALDLLEKAIQKAKSEENGEILAKALSAKAQIMLKVDSPLDKLELVDAAMKVMDEAIEHAKLIGLNEKIPIWHVFKVLVKLGQEDTFDAQQRFYAGLNDTIKIMGGLEDGINRYFDDFIKYMEFKGGDLITIGPVISEIIELINVNQDAEILLHFLIRFSIYLIKSGHPDGALTYLDYLEDNYKAPPGNKYLVEIKRLKSLCTDLS